MQIRMHCLSSACRLACCLAASRAAFNSPTLAILSRATSAITSPVERIRRPLDDPSNSQDTKGLVDGTDDPGTIAGTTQGLEKLAAELQALSSEQRDMILEMFTNKQ